MILVDTNYFLRYLVDREGEQSQTARELFEMAAAGKEELMTTVVVFFEIYFVLKTFYRKEREEIRRILKDILKMEFLGVDDREVLEAAVTNYDRFDYDLEDAYNLAVAGSRRIKEIATFDKKLKKNFEVCYGET